MRQFAKRMTLIARKIRENTVKAVKRAAIAADQAAVLETPVDTGRARANWIVSIGAAVDEESDYTSQDGGREANEGPAGNHAMGQARTIISRYRLGQGGIYINNSLEYIGELDQGSSDQSPQGMTAAAIKAAQHQLRIARLLGGI
jgi:hypothetical protein